MDIISSMASPNEENPLKPGYTAKILYVLFNWR